MGTLYDSCNQTTDALDAYNKAAELGASGGFIHERIAALMKKMNSNSSSAGGGGGGGSGGGGAGGGPGGVGVGGGAHGQSLGLHDGEGGRLPVPCFAVALVSRRGEWRWKGVT